jgi:acyl dehydratase
MDELRKDDDEFDWTIPDDEREYEAASGDEVPFHIPRD